jgi:PAS domain S-box-containing protein
MPPRTTKKATALAQENERLERELRRRVEELERERDFIRTVVNSTSALFCVLDERGCIVRFNSALEQLSGHADGHSTRGGSFHDLFVVPGEAADVRRRLGGEDDVEHESAFRRADGSAAIVAWSKRRLPDADGRERILFSGVDVTELKREQERLRASRARIVQAADMARHRIERDLHDGAQQRLVSLSLSLRIARKALADGKEAAAERQLVTVESELSEALRELRELARGIHPAVLTDRGLPDALETLAVRSPVPVEVERAPDERLDPQIEAAIYYFVAEGLTNVAKYARARVASVRVVRVNGDVVAEVEDDGVGGADEAAGSGLRGLADRIEALEGTLYVQSPRGGPTVLRATIPVFTTSRSGIG